MLRDANDDARGRKRGSLEEVYSQGKEEWRELGVHETREEFLDGDTRFLDQSGTANRSASLTLVLPK